MVVEDMQTHKQIFLAGHTNAVTCFAIGNSGKYIASGQVTHMGFKADILVWDYENALAALGASSGQPCPSAGGNPGIGNEVKPYARLALHKVKVQALAFSPSEKYLVSLGGEDDGSVVVWSLAKKDAICGSPAQIPSAGITECLAYANNDDRLFFTAGE